MLVAAASSQQLKGHKWGLSNGHVAYYGLERCYTIFGLCP